MRRAPTKRFLFRLALRLGWMNPYEMARRMPSRLLAEWEAYAAIEPFEETRADYNAAHIVSMLYNINRDAKSEPRPLSDFVLQFDDPETPEEKQRKRDEQLANKMRVMELIMRAQAEAAAESRQPPPTTHEHAYPTIERVYPTIDAIGTDGGKATTEVLRPATFEEDERERRALAAARAASRS